MDFDKMHFSLEKSVFSNWERNKGKTLLSITYFKNVFFFQDDWN